MTAFSSSDSFRSSAAAGMARTDKTNDRTYARNIGWLLSQDVGGVNPSRAIGARDLALGGGRVLFEPRELFEEVVLVDGHPALGKHRKMFQHAGFAAAL